MKDRIVVRGARQHNLKGFDLEIPRRAFTVVTGPSGSGKSSLAFDTIYAEGQRRYVESLSAYARQFLERMEKPDVDSIDGLSPAVAIEQKNPTKTSRSTVGTATEIYDYLRLLWARVGRTFCPDCGRELQPDTVQSVTDAVLALPRGHALLRRVPAAALRRGHARRRRREPARAGLRARQRSTASSCTSTSSLIERDRPHVRQRSCSSSSIGSSSADDARGRLADAVGDRVPRGRRRLRRSSSPSRSHAARRATGRAAALHRALRVPERRHARADADAAALLVQQSARRVPQVQRLRRDARVRRGAHRPLPRRARCATARSIRGRCRATTTSGARSPSSRSAKASRWTRRGSSFRRRTRRSCCSREGRAASRASFPSSRSRGEAVQAVHPRLPAAVPDRAGVSRLPRHEAAAGGAAGARRRPQHRRRSASCRSTSCSRGSTRSR